MKIVPFFDEATYTMTYVLHQEGSRHALVIDPVLDFDPASGKIDEGSVQKVLDLLHSEKADPQAVAAIVDRSAGKVKLSVPLVSLLQLEIQSYLPEECPLCKKGLALSKPKGKPVKKG